MHGLVEADGVRLCHVALHQRGGAVEVVMAAPAVIELALQVGVEVDAVLFFVFGDDGGALLGALVAQHPHDGVFVGAGPRQPAMHRFVQSRDIGQDLVALQHACARVSSASLISLSRCSSSER